MYYLSILGGRICGVVWQGVVTETRETGLMIARTGQRAEFYPWAEAQHSFRTYPPARVFDRARWCYVCASCRADMTCVRNRHLITCTDPVVLKRRGK